MSKEQDRIIRKQTSLIVVSVVLSLCTLIILSIVGYHQIVLIKEEIKSVVPVLPTLRLGVEPKIQYGSYEFTWSKTKDGEFLRLYPALYINVYNVGKMDTGHIYLTSIDKKFESSGIYIGNIHGLSANTSYFRLWFTNCTYDPENLEEFKRLCNKDTIPTGEHEVIFKVECDYCDRQEFNFTVNICIWKDASIGCKNQQ